MNDQNDHPGIHIAHRLLRARDWQDREQFEQLCTWWRGSVGGYVVLGWSVRFRLKDW